MVRIAMSRLMLWPAAILACSVVVLAFGAAGMQPAAAAPSPFASLPGQWAGTGIIRVRNNEGEHTERVRCSANNDLKGDRDINLRITCKSDSYNFDLNGNFQVDAGDHVSGRWTETTRNIGGTGIGTARGERLQIHVESSALSGNLGLVTRGKSQSVSLDAAGAGQSVKASVTLRRSSR